MLKDLGVFPEKIKTQNRLSHKILGLMERDDIFGLLAFKNFECQK